jgi:hypothetical protein
MPQTIRHNDVVAAAEGYDARFPWISGQEEMRATPELVLEVATSVPDLSVREESHFVPGSHTPDQMQRTVSCYDEIHAFDMVINTEA